MKILHTTEFYHPSVGGVQEVVKQISELLAKMGHDVTVATSKMPNRRSHTINGVKIQQFNISGSMVYGYRGETSKYQKFLIESDFDVITNFSAQQWATDLCLEVIDNIKAKKVFVPTGFSALKNPQFKNYFKLMEKWMKNFDMNIFLSRTYHDIAFARRCGVKKMKIIPNGASEDEFLKNIQLNIRKILKVPQNHFLILHIGSHTGIKGHKEAMQIFKQARIKDSTLLIVGNTPLPGGCQKKCQIQSVLFNFSAKKFLDRKKIIIANISREETIAAYQVADLFLFPSNIECSPIVLFECLASKTPFLATNVGNTQELIKWTGAGVLLPTTKDKIGFGKAKIKESAIILENLYKDYSKRKKMQDVGFKAWSKNFTWKKISRDYEKTYASLIKNKR